VVVTPECFTDGYVSTEDHVTAESLRQYAIDPAASPIVDGVSAWARTNRAWVILGCSRIAPDGVRNSARFSIHKIDLNEVDRIRADPTSHVKDRRPELYAR
jgi:predicted amidohydrolase